MIIIDPRIKLLQTLICGIMLFAIKTIPAQTVNILYLTIVLVLLGRRCGAVKFAGTYIAAFLIYFLCEKGAAFGVLGIISYFAFFIVKILPMSAMAIIMTKTVSPAQLMGAFQRLGIHRNVTIPFTVAMRFLPSLRLEISYIRDAMKMRGINTGPAGIIKSPFRVLEYVTVPLLMRCVKVTDELSASAIVRGIENPQKRTMMEELRPGTADLIYAAVLLTVTGTVFLIDRSLAI